MSVRDFFAEASNGEIEIKLRSEKESSLIKIEKACETVTSLISNLKTTE